MNQTSPFLTFQSSKNCKSSICFNTFFCWFQAHVTQLLFSHLRNNLQMIHPGAVLRYHLNTETNDGSFPKQRPTEIKEIELREHHLQSLERRHLPALSSSHTVTSRMPDLNNSVGAILLQHTHNCINSQCSRNIHIHLRNNPTTSDFRTCHYLLQYFRLHRSRLSCHTHFQLLCRPPCLHITHRHFHPHQLRVLTQVYRWHSRLALIQCAIARVMSRIPLRPSKRPWWRRIVVTNVHEVVRRLPPITICDVTARRIDSSGTWNFPMLVNEFVTTKLF